MELRTLRYFVTVAEELNITKAAVLLNISQPPLSLQLKNLEEELDTVLFIRGKRQLTLTESGKLLYQRAKDILSLAEKTESEIRSLKAGMSGTVAIGLVEGMPVVTDPGILSPEAFLKEVLEKRLPNPFMPDTPQRIACDTSQKVPIRFGETVKSRLANGTAGELEGIPLAIAAWLRYLLAVDDEGKPMEVSPDPMREGLQEALKSVKFGDPDSVGNALEPILSNPVIFAVNLYETPLAGKIENAFRGMLVPGGVRKSLQKV